MKEVWPFDETAIAQLFGKEMVLSRIEPTERAMFRQMDRFSLLADGKTNTDIEWQIDQGRLILSSAKQRVGATIDGLAVVNESIYATGRDEHKKMKTGDPLHVALYPFKSFQGSVKVCISTHVDYVEHTMQRMLKGLLSSGFTKDEIVVFVGGADSRRITEEKGIEFVYLNHNSFEYGALIEIAESQRGDADYWYLLHDTATVESHFKKRVMSLDMGMNWDVVYACCATINKKFVVGNFNIGLYRSSFIHRIKPFLQSLKNIDKVNGIRVEIGRDRRGIRHQANAFSLINGLNNKGFKVIGQGNVYNQGVNRKTISLPDMGIVKYQANMQIAQTGVINKA